MPRRNDETWPHALRERGGDAGLDMKGERETWRRPLRVIAAHLKGSEDGGICEEGS